MKLTRLASFFVIAVLSLPQIHSASAADADSAAERIFAHFDKNNDQTLNPTEFNELPATIRVWFRGKGLKGEQSLARADFLKFYPEMAADLRTGKTLPSKPPEDDGGPFAGADSETTTAPKTGSTSGSDSSLYVSGSEPEEIDTSGNSTRLDGDLNGDGQVSFAEWRKANPGQIADFHRQDANGDFVLSASELGVTSSRSDDDDDDDDRDSRRKPVEIVAYDKLTDDQKEKYAEIVKKDYFGVLDENKDGKLQEKEWEASSFISGKFRDKKIDLKEDMPFETFLTHYSEVIGTEGSLKWKEYVEKNPPPEDARKSDSDDDSKSDSKDDDDRDRDRDDDDRDGDEKPAAAKVSKAYQDRMKGFFTYMDRNKNGKLDPDEWGVSQRIKPAFQRAKVDISKPMDEKTFYVEYVKVFGNEGTNNGRKTTPPRTRGKTSGKRPGGFGGNRGGFGGRGR